MTDSKLGLFTDAYEIRMLESYLRLGMLEPATFSLYSRASQRRPFYLSAGLDLALDVLDQFRFDGDDLAYLRGQGVSEPALEWLAEMRPSGELWAVPDGTILLAGEPLLELTAPLPVAQLLETALMNAMHGSTLVATKAARLVRAAGGRALIDMGFRRAHGLETGVRAARAAYIGGCASTSNVEAGRRWGIPIAGTMAHSFVQSFTRELDAFREFALDHPDTTLLVDTYEPLQGVANAIRAARALEPRGMRIGAIRIDSQPLLELGVKAREMLDETGLHTVRLIASGGLDEVEVRALVDAKAPYDAFGVGSALVCSSDNPALDLAYKLVDYAGIGRAKYSAQKATLPGKKQIFRRGRPEHDLLELRDAPPPTNALPLLELCWRDGERLLDPDFVDVEAARTRAALALAELPDAWFLTPGPDKAPEPALGPELAAQVRAVNTLRPPAPG